MEYTKQHPANTWETEYELIQSQVNDNKATLNTLLAQAAEAETKKSSAATLLDLLEDSRQNAAERNALRKLELKPRLQASAYLPFLAVRCYGVVPLTLTTT